MDNQLSIFHSTRGEELARTGLELAVETANAEHQNWSDRCWQLFRVWLNSKPRYHEFMIEDFREYLYSYDLIEKPQSDRAFGFIAKRALKQDLIFSVGMRRVKNEKAHSAIACLWAKK